ncbi:MAG: DUF308 domain-containing protein [Eggerthellaceae bacterium]|nr:DUF308 domain-containing protein [Eggerthellaceae bacterium]
MNRKVNWWLVIGGAVLVVCGIAIFVAPAFFLEFITVWAGAGFIVSGVAGFMSYFQRRRGRDGAAWSLVMAILDLLLGILFIFHPFAFVSAIPWILGVAIIVFGIAEIVGMMPFARLVPESRIVAIISGVLSVIVGVMFVVWPASLSIWIAVFALVRGITLVVAGLTAR